MAEATGAGLPATLQQLGSPAVRQGVGLMLAVATAVALLVGAWLWSQTPDYRVLFANVSDRDGGEIVAALTQMNVPYKFAEGGGAILVPSDRVHDARLRLASQGLPKGSLAGFELMENARLGTSQFQEQVNYQRALEGELARSIQSIAAVQTARVHLAIPKPSVFLRETQKPSASILVNLYPGRLIEPGQVSAIAHLVSSSVADLPFKNVTVVDQNGTLLSGANAEPDSPLDPGQLKYVKEIERGLTQRIEAILEPFVGKTNVRAQVTADVDFSQTEAAEELYRPNQNGDAAIRASKSNEAASTQPGNGIVGVPGAYSNQAPAPAAAPIEGPGTTPADGAKPANGNATSTQKDSAIDYEVDKTVRHTRQSVGTVKRLSVAVVINHKRSVGADGKVSYAPLSQDEMTQINNLVKEAMGFTQARGDSVTVANAPFTSEDTIAAEEIAWWKQATTLAMAKDVGKHLLIALVVLFVVFKILRPMFRSVLAPVMPEPAAQLPAQIQLPPDSDAIALPGAPARRQYERTLESARQMAKDDPKLVASIVKNWVSDEG